MCKVLLVAQPLRNAPTPVNNKSLTRTDLGSNPLTIHFFLLQVIISRTMDSFHRAYLSAVICSSMMSQLIVTAVDVVVVLLVASLALRQR